MIIADNDNAHAVEDSQENFWAHVVYIDKYEGKKFMFIRVVLKYAIFEFFN